MQRISAPIRENEAAQGRGWDWRELRTRSLREATRILPDPEAEEAVQEALIRAWARRDACRAPEAPLPWVLEITRNEVRRLLMRRARRRRGQEIEARPWGPQPDEDPLNRAATRVTVEQALARLEDADRRVLRLRYADDLTQAEVARRLSIPEGTVKVRLHRARLRLRPMLEDSR